MLGSIAIIAPEVATLFVATFIGSLFIVSAVAHFYLAFQVHGGLAHRRRHVGWRCRTFAGTWLLVNPEVGAAAMTLLMAAYFVATGVVKAIEAFQLRHVKGWGWTFVSALASILLGCIVSSGWPGTAAWAVGLWSASTFCSTAGP